MFATEPLPAGHELTTLPNVTLSAHSAFRTPEATDKLIRRALDIATVACSRLTGRPAWRNGRRSGLKIRSQLAWGFESPGGHRFFNGRGYLDSRATEATV